MKILIKKLQGGECNLEVGPDTLISEIKRQISEKLHISVEEQKLLLLGRTLADDQRIKSYPTIKEGTKLNLVVKKPEGLFEVSKKQFKLSGMSEAEATAAAHRLIKVVQEKFDKLSWDDIDKLAYDCMLDERGVPPTPRPAPKEQEPDTDDLYAV